MMTGSPNEAIARVQDSIVDSSARIAITGSNGFIGVKVVEKLLGYGFTFLRCFVRRSSNLKELERVIGACPHAARVEIMIGNLQSRDDCGKLAAGASLVYHLAAARGEKSYADAFHNSVVTTRNLLDAVGQAGVLRRFVNVSSFAVYSNSKLAKGALLDETCEREVRPHLRGDAYSYAKARQEDLVFEYGGEHGIPYVILRPGVVYGPGNKGIHGRVGVGTFGIFLHLGGSNRVPLSYVDNCADAIVLAGLKSGIEGQIFNVVDDDLPTSRQFLKIYKRNVRNFGTVYLPGGVSHLLCYLWEKYSKASGEQLPPLYNTRMWSANWKGNTYTNEKLKRLVGWAPKVSFDEAMRNYCEYQRKAANA